MGVRFMVHGSRFHDSRKWIISDEEGLFSKKEMLGSNIFTRRLGHMRNKLYFCVRNTQERGFINK